MEIAKTENEWKKKLDRKRYHVMGEKGTEIPFTERLLHNKNKGNYLCGACGSKLFSSDTRFDDGSGSNEKRFCINSCALDFKEK